MDNASEARNTLPMNSADLEADCGNAAFDIRHVISAGFTYNLPAFAGRGWRRLAVQHRSRRFRAARRSTSRPAPTPAARATVDRPNLVGDPFANLRRRRDPLLQYLQPGGVRGAGSGDVRQLARNAYYGPWFKTVDVSVFKTTKLTSHASVQLRAEIFNLFNWVNWANPGATLSSSTSFGLLSNTRNADNAPGIGAGEPFNVQLAAKLLF